MCVSKRVIFFILPVDLILKHTLICWYVVRSKIFFFTRNAVIIPNNGVEKWIYSLAISPNVLLSISFFRGCKYYYISTYVYVH